MLDEKLAELLKRVQKPGRYVGGEWNVVTKEAASVRASLALCYPDVYEAGMASLGVHLLYDVVNGDQRFACERAFLPWVDMAAEMRREGLPLFTLDSRRGVADFDVVGFFLDSQLRYTNVLEALDLAGLPLSAEGRDASHPLVVAFGPCAANPEPLAEFIDIFVVGEPEEALLELMELAAETKGSANRAEVVNRAALLPGVYAPSRYSVSYKADGSVEAIAAARGAADSVHKRMLDSLGPAPASPVVPFLEVADGPGMVEIQRGCGPGCPQCETGSACGLVRRRSVANVAEVIDGLVHSCGYQDVRLLSSGVPELSVLEQAVRAVRARHSAEDLSLSLPDMPLGDQSIAVAQLLADNSRRRGYALEPIAATDRLREAIGQPLAQEGLLSGVEALFRYGWSAIKYRFTIGLPTETMDDVRAIVGLVVETQRIGQRVLGKRPRVRVAVSIFTPRPHTLLQRAGQETLEGLQEKLDFLRQGLKKAGAPAPLPEPAPSLVEAVLARGDRRVGKAVHRAWQLGCTFDAWSQRFDFARWLQALEECGLSPAFYAQRPRADGELLPWAHLDFSQAAPSGPKGHRAGTQPAGSRT